MCFEDDVYQDEIYCVLAQTQLQAVREYSPAAFTILDKLNQFGAKAVFRAAFILGLYKYLLESTNGIPEQFDYYCLIEDCPQIMPSLDDAINYVLEDWFCRK